MTIVTITRKNGTKTVKVIVDTNIWSEALRLKNGMVSKNVQLLNELIINDQVQLNGIIKMEILCGIKSEKTFDDLLCYLNGFPDRELTTDLFVLASKFFNLCRSNGIQGSTNDYLICACGVLWGMPIFTEDKDFVLFKKYIPIELFKNSS